MYTNPVLLNSIIHKSLRVGQLIQFGFAEKMNSVMIVAQEFFEAAKQYPVLFSKGTDGALIAVAITGIQRNLFIDSAGAWANGYYLPAFLRRYPYILSEDETQRETLSVCIDKDFIGFDDPDGARLFTDDGGMTPILEHTVDFLRLYHEQSKITGAFVAKIDELKILKPVDVTVALNCGEKYTMGGLSMVDEDVLQKLSNNTVMELFRLGYLPWVYVHLCSLANFNTIINRMSNVVPLQEN